MRIASHDVVELELPTGVSARAFVVRFLERTRLAFLSLRARNVVVGDDCISLDGGLLRAVGNWNLLVPVDTVSVHVSAERGRVRIEYSLGFVTTLVVGTLMSLMLASALRAVGDPAAPFAAAVCFIWLVGGNYAISKLRFRWFFEARGREVLAELAAHAATARTSR